MATKKSFLGTGWSFPPRFDQDLGAVEMVSEEKDIEESLRILMSTFPGERITNLEYGCDLQRVLFAPMNASTQSDIQEIIKNAVLYFEPRVTLEEVEIDTRLDVEGVVMITLHYVVRKTNIRSNVVFPFYQIEGTSIVDL